MQRSVQRAVSKPSAATELNPPHVSLQLVRWATSSPSPAPFPAQSARPTAEPARKDRLHVNAAAAFIGQPVMPTPQPAQVSFVSLFVYAWFSGRRSRGLRGHLLLTLTVGTETYSHRAENTFYQPFLKLNKLAFNCCLLSATRRNIPSITPDCSMFLPHCSFFHILTASADVLIFHFHYFC